MSIKKKSIIGIVAIVFVVITIGLLGKNKLSGTKVFTVQKSNFESIITVKGEIQGKNAVLISLPDDLKKRDLRIHDLQIKDLVQEGTHVKKGDWVATLDVANITQQIQSNKDELERKFAEFKDAKIDSAIELTKLREEIKEFQFDLEYKALELEQSKYESPAYQRKVKVDFNKTIRQMDKKRRDYELKKLDLKVRIKRDEDRYNYYMYRDSLLKKAVIAARIIAPQEGMVMYAKLWGGRKLRVGDGISPWNPTIATLPDMSVLVSETYIEEIQITKIEIGDSVEIIVDALPDKVFSGFVSKIANIGQELSGFDSKVFRVLLELKESDSSLKPSMTSSNNIVISNINDVLTIPRECLFSSNGDSFVYMRKSGKIWKQKVIPGKENEKEIIIQSGLEENDKILYSAPEKNDEIYFAENKNITE